MSLSPFHALYTARELSAYANSADKLAAAYASSDIEVYPYQIAAATFAMRSPFLKGVILADEGSLGKTYEALLVISQMWFEGKERILIVVPTPILGQWTDIMDGCFSVPYMNTESGLQDSEQPNVVLTTYDRAVKNTDWICSIAWNAVVFEEAHRLNNKDSKTTAILKEAVGDAYKILLTATPMQNSIMDLYGLLHFIDDTVLGDEDEFYKRYFRKPENYHELTTRISRYVFRTLRSQVENYVKIPNRLPVTADYKLTADELRLSAMLEDYLKKSKKSAFPKMETWDLSLMLWRSLSSSTFAFDKLLRGAIEREPEPELVEMQKLSAGIVVNAKGQELLKTLKKAFAELKKRGANRKALIFTESRATQEYLKNLLNDNGYNVLSHNGDKSRDYDIIRRFESETDVLVATDTAAEGFNLAFCSFVVNYDMPYNVLMLEQRIMRCHRQGQQNDVIVLNFLNKTNFADARMLELINKRVLQFDGIVGMSDDVVGNFTDSAVDGIAAAFNKSRHQKDIDIAFQATLTSHESENTAAVNEAESVLFTTFTRDIADRVSITPQYIKDRTIETNAKLWELTKWFFAGKQGYECVEENRTVHIGIQPQKVFTGAHLGRREYSIDNKTLPKSGRHTVCGTLAKNIIGELFWRGIPDSGTVTVSEPIEPCHIAYYRVKVKPNGAYWGGAYYNAFVGRTAGGEILTNSECLRIMDLPVAAFTSSGDTYGERDGVSKPKSKNDLDELVNIDDFIKRAVTDTDEARREEIACVNDRTYHQKQALNRNISLLKNQLLQIENALSKAGNVSEKIDAEKKQASFSRELKQKEQSLFLDGIRLDTEAERIIKELTEQANLTAEVTLQFVIRVEGK